MVSGNRPPEIEGSWVEVAGGFNGKLVGVDTLAKEGSRVEARRLSGKWFCANTQPAYLRCTVVPSSPHKKNTSYILLGERARDIDWLSSQEPFVHVCMLYFFVLSMNYSLLLDTFVGTSWIWSQLRSNRTKVRSEQPQPQENIVHASGHDLPTGFRFHPSDYEIVNHYLTNKVHNRDFTCVASGELDLYKIDPWDLYIYALVLFDPCSGSMLLC